VVTVEAEACTQGRLSVPEGHGKVPRGDLTLRFFLDIVLQRRRGTPLKSELLGGGIDPIGSREDNRKEVLDLSEE
jgi:hypothetical protein